MCVTFVSGWFYFTTENIWQATCGANFASRQRLWASWTETSQHVEKVNTCLVLRQPYPILQLPVSKGSSLSLSGLGAPPGWCQTNSPTCGLLLQNFYFRKSKMWMNTCTYTFESVIPDKILVYSNYCRTRLLGRAGLLFTIPPAQIIASWTFSVNGTHLMVPSNASSNYALSLRILPSLMVPSEPANTPTLHFRFRIDLSNGAFYRLRLCLCI